MAFLNNKKYKEILEASRGGNEKALMIMQAMTKGNSQDEIDGLVNDYYNVAPDINNIQPEGEPMPEVDEPMSEEAMETEMEEVAPEEVNEIPPVIDLTSQLDGEMDGLLDETEIEDLSFGDYLKNKRRDGLRAKKNSDYFKAFDMEGRTNYMANKEKAYSGKFDVSRRSIERMFNDNNKALDNYASDVNLMLDDDFDLDMNNANQAYDELTDNEGAMSSFGRHWDDMDNENMKNVLQELVVKYGKKNVMAALNTLRGDVDGYSKFRNNQIDTEIGRYSKSLENLLK